MQAIVSQLLHGGRVEGNHRVVIVGGLLDQETVRLLLGGRGGDRRGGLGHGVLGGRLRGEGFSLRSSVAVWACDWTGAF